jgi:hypothetical protein
MPDAIIQNVVFQVGATDTDTLRASWQKAKARYAPELAAKQIDAANGLGPALDKWAVSYTAFSNSVREINNQKALWTTLAPLARAKIKTEARTLQTDAAEVAKFSANYLTAIHALGNPAEKDLTTILMAIARRAADHQLRASLTSRAR